MCPHTCATMCEVRGRSVGAGSLPLPRVLPGYRYLTQVITSGFSASVFNRLTLLALLFIFKLIHKNIEIVHINGVPCNVLLHGSTLCV